MTAPLILTERLRLDGHRADDLDPLAAMWREPAVYAGIGGVPREREEVWLRLLRSIGQWTLSGYGAWAVRERAGGALVGEVGLIEARRAIEPALEMPEMGWLIAPGAQRRGYAREALDAILGWADRHGVARSCCIIDPGNATSIRLATAVGYAEAGIARYRGKPINLYRRDARSTGEAGQ